MKCFDGTSEPELASENLHGAGDYIITHQPRDRASNLYTLWMKLDSSVRITLSNYAFFAEYYDCIFFDMRLKNLTHTRARTYSHTHMTRTHKHTHTHTHIYIKHIKRT